MSFRFLCIGTFGVDSGATSDIEALAESCIKGKVSRKFLNMIKEYLIR